MNFDFPPLNWLLLPLALCLLLACNTYRSNAGYLVTDINHVALTNNEIYAKTGEKLCSDEAHMQPGNERCIFMEVTLLHAGHTIKAICEPFDKQNHCSEIQVGKSYGFKRDVPGFLSGMGFLSLEDPQMTLSIEEEHGNSR